MEELQVVGIDVVLFFEHRLFDPVEQAAPIVGADEHNREVRDLGGLYQRQGFEQFIERSEAAGHGDEPLRIFQEDGLPVLKQKIMIRFQI